MEIDQEFKDKLARYVHFALELRYQEKDPKAAQHLVELISDISDLIAGLSSGNQKAGQPDGSLIDAIMKDIGEESLSAGQFDSRTQVLGLNLIRSALGRHIKAPEREAGAAQPVELPEIDEQAVKLAYLGKLNGPNFRIEDARYIIRTYLIHAKSPGRTGWVIEHIASDISTPEYWSGAITGTSGWSQNHNLAVRFARGRDAEIIRDTLLSGGCHRLAEHIWSNDIEVETSNQTEGREHG